MLRDVVVRCLWLFAVVVCCLLFVVCGCLLLLFVVCCLLFGAACLLSPLVFAAFEISCGCLRFVVSCLWLYGVLAVCC